MILATSDTIPGREVEAIGTVTAAVCFSKSVLSDMAANVKNWSVGGELGGYTRMMETATELVLERLREKALGAGAEAVVALRLVNTDVCQGAAELVAYGTAVVYRET